MDSVTLSKNIKQFKMKIKSMFLFRKESHGLRAFALYVSWKQKQNQSQILQQGLFVSVSVL